MKPTDELLSRAVTDVVPRKLAEDKLKEGKPLRIYLGIDPTGAKLHLGHSVPLRKLKAFQDAGHEVIFLIGSFTAMIGDPTGRDTQREPLTQEQVMANFETYKQQASKILDFSNVEIHQNHEWLSKLTFKKILELSSHFTVQQMLQRDMFKERMKKEQDLSLMEMFYPLMQGYDSLAMDVDAELGGNDQLFNMLAGRTLMQKMRNKEKFVLTTKLIEGTDGRKMSKTYDNCIWLEDSAQEMFGKTMRIGDDLITTYMECLTDIPMDEIADVEMQMKKSANPMEFKKQLARAIVALYHGEKAADDAEAAFKNVFADKGVPDHMPEVAAEKGTLIVDLIVNEKLAASKSEAKRLIEQGGVKLDDNTVASIDATVEKGILKVGKRKFVKII